MGCANNWLIAPAVLYNNPGITKEEFVELLNETRTGDGDLKFYNFDHWKNALWNFVGVEDDSYHKGLHGLAFILGLNYSDSFNKIKWKDKDSRGFRLKPPFLSVDSYLVDGKWKTFYLVDIHTGNKSLESRIFQEIETHKFYSVSSLARKHFYFDPEFMYDFSKNEGVFSYPPKLVDHNFKEGFKWHQKEGKYFLEIENLRGFSKFFNERDFHFQSGYTDLVVTSEALKRKAWKMFTFHAYEEERTKLFFREFPEANEVYERAVWDAYTSEGAIENKMSVNEFLRFRLLSSKKR